MVYWVKFVQILSYAASCSDIDNLVAAFTDTKEGTFSFKDSLVADSLVADSLVADNLAISKVVTL